MTDVLVICPTRGRPGAALEVQTSFDTTKTIGSELIFAVDEDDPALPEYVGLPHLLMVRRGEGGNMTKALNVAAMSVLDPEAGLEPAVLGFMGDDHRFRSYGWDRQVMADIERMGGTGMVYGNDKAHSSPHLPESELLPTFVFISSAIVRALGFFALPTARHLFLDDTWKALGNGLGKLKYDPSIVIEHMHPAYGKAEWDEGHVRVNSAEIRGHDRAAFEAWLTGDGEPSYTGDLEKVRAVL